MNEFEHDGHPNRKQQAEILKLISLAGGYSGGTVGMLSYALSNWGDRGFEATIALILGLLGIILSGWAIVIAFAAVKGKAPALTATSAAIIAGGLVVFGFGCALGAVLGVALA